MSFAHVLFCSLNVCNNFTRSAALKPQILYSNASSISNRQGRACVWHNTTHTSYRSTETKQTVNNPQTASIENVKFVHEIIGSDRDWTVRINYSASNGCVPFFSIFVWHFHFWVLWLDVSCTVFAERISDSEWIYHAKRDALRTVKPDVSDTGSSLKR